MNTTRDSFHFVKIQGHCLILRNLRLVRLPNRKLRPGASDLPPLPFPTASDPGFFL